MKSNTLYRLKLLFAGLMIFAVVLIFKLYSIQVVEGEKYSQQASSQYFRPNYYLFDRGGIFFQTRDGTAVPAAGQRSGFVVSINPSAISNPERVYEEINSIIPLDYQTFISRAGRKETTYQEILRRVEAPDAEAIGRLNISGLNVNQERWRYYPGESMASHLLGIVAYNDHELAGRYGLERYYESVLVREDEETYVNFFAEVFLNIKDTISSTSSRSGDVITSVEPSVQAFLESQIEELNDKWSSEYSGGIIMDPATGRITAMAVNPDFNPNSFRDVENSRIFSNPLIENVYEMGSVIKPLTVAAGLDSGAVTPYSTYFDHGFLVLNTRTISNYDGRGRGIVDMQRVLNDSLNTGVAFIVSQMGNREFADYMLKFGLGDPTGIDLPNESVGLVDNLKSTRDIEYVTASFGQGIAMTPVSVARALSSLANGGTLVTPRLVDRIDYSDGSTKIMDKGVGKRAISPEASEEITRMLVNVVDEALLGGSVKMTNYSIAAKTGTAQIPRAAGGGYYDDKFLHSFFGYFPAYDPEFLVFMYSYDPKEVEYASETLTHSFMDIARFLINYYDIPPDR